MKIYNWYITNLYILMKQYMKMFFHLLFYNWNMKYDRKYFYYMLIFNSIHNHCVSEN